MTTTSSVGICTSCGAGFARGTAFCTSCGAPVVSAVDARVLAERAPATAVFGPPPPAETTRSQAPVTDDGPESGISLFRRPRPAPPASSAAPDEYEPQFAAAPLARRPKRSPKVMLGAAAAVVAMVVAGLWVANYLEDRPVRAALQDATTAYAGVVDAMTAARTLDDVAAVGDTARRAGARLDAAADGLQGEDDLAVAATRMVRAQAALVAAATPLSDLASDSLEVWGQVEGSLTDAAAAVTSAKRGLAAVDSGAAQAVADPGGAVDQVRDVVGGTAQERLTGVVAGLVDGLAGAKRTAQVRRVAEEARDSRAVVRAAAPGLIAVEADRGEAQVEAVTSFVSAVAALRRLDRDTLAAWSRIRERIVAARVTGVNTAPALESLDRLVERGTTRMERWQARVDSIRDRQQADLAALATYADPVDAQLARYDDLRSQLSAFFEQVQDQADDDRRGPPRSTYVVGGRDVREVLTEAAQGRRAVQEALKQIDAPAEYAEEHDALVVAARRGAVAVERALAELDDGCFDCTYADSASYRNLAAASETVSAAYAEATSDWRSAVGATRSAIEDRKVPRKPVV